MELIRNLGTRISKKGHKDSWGVFYCEYCKQEVEKLLHIGKKAKSCGCVRLKLISLATKGLKFTEEHRNNISKANKGKKRTDEQRKNISEFRKGRKHSEETRIKQSKASKGKRKSEEHRINLSKAKKGKYVRELSSQWQGGISFLPYPPEFNKELKQFILERDNYTCQCPNCKNNFNYLIIHHIDYDKKNNNLENLITLCNRCHSETVGKNNRQYWIVYYQNIMRSKHVF